MLGSSLPACAFGPMGPGTPRSSLVHQPSGATLTAFPSCVFAPLQGISPEELVRHLSVANTSPEIPCRSAYEFRRNLLPPAPPKRPGYVPRSGFRTRFAVCSSLGLAGLFHPANALRLRPTGSFPLKEPRQLFAAALPSCRCSAVAPPPSRKTGPAAHLAYHL